MIRERLGPAMKKMNTRRFDALERFQWLRAAIACLKNVVAGWDSRAIVWLGQSIPSVLESD
jgi:hypothetical protein